MADEDREVEELRAMMAAGPPSMRGTAPARGSQTPATPAGAPFEEHLDFMSTHMKNLREAANSDKMNHTVGHQAHMPADNFLQNHLRKVKEQTSPSKSWQGTASQMPHDSFLQAHNKKMQAESGPKVFKSTKLYGVPPKGVKTDNYMMAFVAQVEKDKKGGVSSIGMVPKVGADSLDSEFLKKMAVNNKTGESSIGLAPKLTGDSYMASHSKKMLEDNKPKKGTSSLGMVTHMPADSYMAQHLKSVNEINTMNKQTHTGEQAHVPADSFMIDFHKKAKEANATRPIPHKQGHLPHDSYMLAQMKEIKEMNQQARNESRHDKASIGTDDFTMSVLRKAQKDVMSY